MTIKRILLHGAKTVTLPLEGVGPLTPYVIKAADGLGPPDIDVSITRTLIGYGHYQRRQAQLRNIVLRIGLQPEWNIGQSPADLRADLYGLLTPKFGQMVGVELVSENDQVFATTEGHLQRLEIAPFSKDPEVQVTIACTYPYLYHPNLLTQSPARTVSGSTSSFTIFNPGTAPSGFIAVMRYLAPATGTQTLSDEDPFGQKFSVTEDFATGDILGIDTRAGKRNVYKILSGTFTPLKILGKMTEDSTWLQLHGGDNVLRLNHPNFEWVGANFQFQPAFWGV